MSALKLKPGHVWIEIVSGVEGPSLYVGDGHIGYRVAGPKPWGGGRTMHRFQVKVEELVREATKYAIGTVEEGL